MASTPNANQLLVVDDEASIRQMLRVVFERQGYEVLEAASAAEAVQIFQKHQSSIAIVLTDVMMPEMNGPELVHQLLKLRPGVLTLFISGFCDTLQHSMQGFECLPKPFTASEVVNKVQSMLHASNGSLAST
jgi:DNA-binding response OmpR family regulator